MEFKSKFKEVLTVQNREWHKKKLPEHIEGKKTGSTKWGQSFKERIGCLIINHFIFVYYMKLDEKMSYLRACCNCELVLLNDELA